MTAVSYPYSWLPVVIVFGVLATIVVPLFAFVWVVVFVVAALVAAVATVWGLVAALRAVGRGLWRRRLHTPKQQGARRSIALRRISGPHSATKTSEPVSGRM